MNPNTAAPGFVKTGASVAIAGAIVELIRDGLTMGKVSVPSTMGPALIILLTPLVHLAAQWISNRTKAADPVATTESKIP
ncbi:MAG: hypothetical protein PHZ23_15900 [Acidiphilium sp.]|nr:hypothetical protein [Acidiphilium sp.]